MYEVNTWPVITYICLHQLSYDRRKLLLNVTQRGKYRDSKGEGNLVLSHKMNQAVICSRYK